MTRRFTRRRIERRPRRLQRYRLRPQRTTQPLGARAQRRRNQRFTVRS